MNVKNNPYHPREERRKMAAERARLCQVVCEYYPVWVLALADFVRPLHIPFSRRHLNRPVASSTSFFHASTLQTMESLVMPCQFHTLLCCLVPSRFPPLQCTVWSSHYHLITLSLGSSLHPMHSIAPLHTSLFPDKLTELSFPLTAFPHVPSPWVIRLRLPSQ